MKKIYSVYDKQHERHNPPFYAVNDIMAKRMFDQAKQDPESDLVKFPQDFKLVCLGAFDETSGHLLGEKHDVI